MAVFDLDRHWLASSCVGFITETCIENLLPGRRLRLFLIQTNLLSSSDLMTASALQV